MVASNSMNQVQINVAKEFTKYPGGRHRVDGRHSGEEFRETFLIPRMGDDVLLTIDFTGVFTVAPSFIDEAFGPLMERLGQQRFDRQFHLIAEDDPELLSDFQTVRDVRFPK